MKIGEVPFLEEVGLEESVGTAAWSCLEEWSGSAASVVELGTPSSVLISTSDPSVVIFDESEPWLSASDASWVLIVAPDGGVVLVVVSLPAERGGSSLLGSAMVLLLLSV
jgi:hypothetical protein